MKRFFSIIHKEFNGINEAAFLLALFAFFSQILALVRDKSLAHFIGPSPTLDVYYAAFRVPDFIYTGIVSLISITVLIPFLLEKTKGEDGNHEKLYRFLNEFLTVFSVAIIVIDSAVFFAIPKLSSLIAPGFSGAERLQLINVSRIMLLSPILLGISNLFGILTQIFRKFFIFALSPVFYNIGIIFGIYVLWPSLGIYGLAWGVVIGAFLHMLVQVPVLVKNRFTPRLVRKLDFRYIKQVIIFSLPRALAMGANSLSVIVLTALATNIAVGSVSIFNFSFSLQTIPLGIIGMSYAVAAFPILTQLHTLGNLEDFKIKFVSAARQIIFWAFPLTFLFIVLRAHIVRVILGSGSFSWSHTRLTAAAFAIFAISIIAQSLLLLLARGYYAAKNTSRPLVVNVFFSFLIIVLAYFFSWIFDSYAGVRYFLESLFRVDSIAGTKILAIAFAYSVGTILNCLALWYLFEKDFLKGYIAPFRKTFFQSFVASFFIGFFAYGALSFFGNFFSLDTFWGVFLQAFFAGIFGITIGVWLLHVMKSEELSQVSSTLKHKFWKTQVVAEQQQELLK
ncbi:MAG: lipid II flippase MurJ [Candidatus Paceibacterota bacterium]|jgi:putative peptidoglycan lipid II flippase